MKINVLSDLHLNHQGLAYPDNDADIVVLAGDIARPKEAVAWAKGIDRPVLYIPGNHEFYGGSIASGLDELRRLCAGSNVHLLQCDELVVDGVRFLGATLWTDTLLFGRGAERIAALDHARRFLRDFSRIYTDAALATLFTPEDAVKLFEHDARWLGARLAAAHPGPTVVITHHAPSRGSIHPRFAGSPLNLCFVSDLQPLLDGRRVQLWIHGHTHDSFDYDINGTRVICNPRGYAMNGINENASFDADLQISIGFDPALTTARPPPLRYQRKSQ